MLNGFSTKIPNLIDRLGRGVLIRTYTNSGAAYDPVRTPTDAVANAAFFDFNEDENFGTTIQENDLLVLIGATATVTKQSKIVDGTEEYNIVALEKVGPGDELFYYKAQCRL